MSIKKFYHLAYALLCLLGLCSQIFLICKEHFAYGVVSAIRLAQTDHYILPSLSTCFAIHEVIDYDSFNNKYDLNFKFNGSNAGEAYMSGLALQPLITIGDAYDFTPPSDQFLESCEIRNFSNHKYHSYNYTECSKWFDIEKYVLSTKLCYKVTLRSFPKSETNQNDQSLDTIVYTRDVAFLTANDIGDLLFLRLNETSLDHFNLIENILHPNHIYPWIELPLSKLCSRDYIPGNGSAKNLFEIESHFINTTKLPPPYVTKCENYQRRTRGKRYIDSTECFNECVKDKVKKIFGKASLGYHYLSGNDLKLPTNEDLSNDKFNEKYSKILDDCHTTCPSNDCNFIVTYTMSVGFAYSRPNLFISFPDQPSFVIGHSPKLILLDTINFICSTLGVWYGFSFYSIYPFKFEKGNLNEIVCDSKRKSMDGKQMFVYGRGRSRILFRLKLLKNYIKRKEKHWYLYSCE